MKLPDALNRAWPKNAMRDLGCWIELAGGDPWEAFKSRDITDHCWLNLRITFPLLADNGYNPNATITRCLIHPQGELMFDVTFDTSVPRHLYSGGEWILHESDGWYGTIQRFRYHELKHLARLARLKETS